MNKGFLPFVFCAAMLGFGFGLVVGVGVERQRAGEVNCHTESTGVATGVVRDVKSGEVQIEWEGGRIETIDLHNGYRDGDTYTDRRNGDEYVYSEAHYCFRKVKP